MGCAGEIIFLGAVVEIGEPIVIASFYLEMADFGAQFYTETGRYTIIELVFHIHVMLFGGKVGIVFPRTALCVAFVQEETDLRSGDEEELQTAAFLAECQMGQERQFDVIHLARVLQVGIVFVELIPSVL